MNENLRTIAINKILNRTHKKSSNEKSPKQFGSKTYMIDDKLINKIIDKTITDNESSKLITEIKNWAIGNNATHYTHWFYPLRGSTAEKHDSFLNLKHYKIKDNNVEFRREFKIEKKLNFKDLLQQEPDASSFPSGGMRSTFESRGYTIWDPTSQLFILNGTLCIPTIFVSYNKKTLDFKTPLLKSLDLLNKSATKVCNRFNDKTKSVNVTLGLEQEFFVIDRSLYLARPDLILTERTLFGHASAKDQQLSNNYFGTMPNRVLKFLKDVEKSAYELGIPLKTRHNEVAPHQFEIAPIHEDINLAVDHNLLLMNILNDISEKHNLKVLFHEKPFSGINGSGKHNNWSLKNDKGINLLSPGKTETEKFRFVIFLINIIKAISEYPNLLRASTATPENEHRLGGHEAPPAIISMFLGKQLTNILNEFENTGNISSVNIEDNISIPNIPDVFIDNTDRNRTSPFAFTGNKFEFRAPGSSINCSKPMTILNLIVADQLQKFDKEIEEKIKYEKDSSNKIIKEILIRYIKESKYIIFEGDGYSKEWIKDAEKRGLKNVKLTPDVQKFYLENKVIDLYERNNILTKDEIISRYEIKLEKYIKKIQIESRVIGDITRNHIIPSTIKYQNILLSNLSSIIPSRRTPSYIISTINTIDNKIDTINKYIKDMIDERKIANNMENSIDMADHYSKKVFPYFEKIRYEVDKLELIVDDSLWTLPKYREMLFLM